MDAQAFSARLIGTPLLGVSGGPGFRTSAVMAPHLTPRELDLVAKLAHEGKTPAQVRARLAVSRDRQHVDTPTVNNVRLAMAGKTFKRGVVETRGRKKKMTPKRIRKVDRCRKALQKKHEGTREVTMPMILRHARVKVDTSTASKALKKHLGVAWRACREKATRTKEQERERALWCGRKRRLSADYWISTVDMIIDCKNFTLPLNVRAQAHALRRRVRGGYRGRAEGLQPELIRPNTKRHRNAGARAWVLAGVIGDRVRVWEYITTRWNGETAAKMYSEVIAKALSRHRPDKPFWRIVEDNDPVGFKSAAGIAAKKAAGIKPVDWPSYSPDLNALDFSLWAEIEQRALAKVAGRTVSATEYRRILRNAALRLPARVVRKAVEDTPRRIQECWECDGGNMPRD